MYVAILFILTLLEVRGSDDFVTKYDKYNSVCKRMGYLHKHCEEREIIAFHARLLTDQKNIKDKAVVVFADVTLNTGYAYSATTGEFTAPLRGHYSFTWTISTTQGALFSTQLVINGVSVGYNHINGRSSGHNHETSSSTVIVKMEKNDVVAIRLYDPGVFAHKMWSSFSGFKL